MRRSRASAGTDRCSIGKCCFAFELEVDGVRGDVHEIQVHEDWEVSQVVVEVRRNLGRFLRGVDALEILAPVGRGQWRLLLPYNTVQRIARRRDVGWSSDVLGPPENEDKHKTA